MASINNNTIIWDESDFLSGLHPNFSAAPSDSPVPRGTNRQLVYSSSMNPYRYFGYASPGFNPTDVTNVSTITNSAIRRIFVGAESSTYYGYGINSNTKLFQIDTTSGALTSAGVWPHTITAASGVVEGNDVVFYSAKVGGTRAPRIFYSYNRTGVSLWDVGVYSLDGATFDDDFMSTAPATPLVSTTDTMPHPMIVGDDDVLYIADGNVLHGYDGASTADADGKFISAVLTLPATFRITSFAKYQKRLGIFGYFERSTSASANPSSFFATQAMAYWWDYLNDDPYDSDDLNDNYVSCALEYKSTVVLFTQGRKPVAGSTQFSRIQIFDGEKFETIAMFDKNVPIWGGAEVVGDTIMWNSQGQVMQFGSPYPGFPDGLNKSTAGSGTDSGCIKTLSTTLQVVSSGTTTSGGLQKITTNFTTGSFTCSLADPSFPPGMAGKMKSIKIEFAKTSTGGRSFDLFLFGNGLSSQTILSTVSTIDSTNIVKEYYANEFSPIQFRDLAVIGQWQSGSGATDAPILKRVSVTFEPINIQGT